MSSENALSRNFFIFARDEYVSVICFFKLEDTKSNIFFVNCLF